MGLCTPLCSLAPCVQQGHVHRDEGHVEYRVGGKPSTQLLDLPLASAVILGK